jgi:carbonic anhydrase/acetyltransferase-like protein (isoleucine patch superfamily)
MAVYALDDKTPELAADVYVADSASVIGNVIMHEGSSVWFGAVVRGDNEPIVIGKRSNVQDNSVLHSDPGSPLHIGEGVTLGHKVMVHGCTIGDNTLIGIGATVLNGAKIGKNCIIGAHALITEGKIIPDGSMVVGSPGKIVKELSQAHIAMLQGGAEVYVQNSKRFKAGLKKIS